MPRPTTAPLLFLALLLAGSPAPAQTPDPAFDPFIPFGQLQAELDGTHLEDAAMFHAARPGAYLLSSIELAEPLLINVRDQRVETVDRTKISAYEDGTLRLQEEAVIGWAGTFEVETNRLVVTLGGSRQLILAPKPHLLGLRTSADIVAHDPSYGYRAGRYPPSGKAIERLRQEQHPVTVRVFFGSWCSACSRVLPWLMAVEKALEGSKISFEYYGLPDTLDDPVAKEAGVKAVPTAVVTAGGKELGRRDSTGLGIPEDALLEILNGG